MTKSEAQIRSEVIATMQSNVARLEAELAADKPGFIHVWPKYGLGAKFDGDQIGVVCVSLATIVKADDKRVFTNGAKVQAVLTERRVAIADALKQARETLAYFETSLAEHDAKTK